MNKSELVVEIAKQTNLNPKECDRILSALIDTITVSVAKGEKITLSGFGTFERRRRKATAARNPKTGERMSIAEQNVATFRAGSALKCAVKGRNSGASSSDSDLSDSSE